MEIDGAAGGLTIGPSGSSSIAPPKPKCALAYSTSTTEGGTAAGGSVFSADEPANA